MAIVIDNIYTKGISGRVGDALLYKHYGNKTVVTAFPRLSLVAPSARQLAQRKKFAMAVLKTRQWLQQKAQKQFLQGLKHKWNSLSAYHAGIKYHMLQAEAMATQATATTGVATTASSVAKQPHKNPVKPVVPIAKKRPDN